MYDEIYVISDIQEVYTAEQIEDINKLLKGALPEGYSEFIQKFGTGYINSYLHLYCPSEILSNTQVAMASLECDFWNNTPSFTFKEQLECFVIGYTIDADYLVVHPNKKGLFLFPRHSDEIFHLGNSFVEMLHWLKDSGIYLEKQPLLFYRPDREMTILVYWDRNNQINKDKILKTMFDLVKPSKHILFDENYSNLIYRRMGADVSCDFKYGKIRIEVDKDYAIEFYDMMHHKLLELGFGLSEKYYFPE